MSCAALVMAGGSGTRMTRSGVDTPKPLVRVAGVPLLEWNLRAVFASGVRDVVVSTSRGVPAIREFVGSRQEMAEQVGGSLAVLEEDEPRGNIGCAADLRGRADALLVVFADNLTLLDLRAILADHARRRPAMTIATHDEPFQMPYGQVEVRDGRVASYVEKPVHHVRVCSAVCVIGPEAFVALPAAASLGLSELVSRLLELGRTVNAYHHEAPWVDVNDHAKLERAEELIATAGHLQLTRTQP